MRSLLICYFSVSKKIPSFGDSSIFSPTLATPKGTCSFNRPWCSSLTGIRASTGLFIKTLFFWWSLHFFAFVLPKYNPPKKQFQRHPSLCRTNPRDTWAQLLEISFLCFNLPQHESNHHKQDLLISTSKISHYLFQFQIFTLDAIMNSTPLHTPLSKSVLCF